MMGMEFIKKLSIPMDVKKMYPATADIEETVQHKIQEIKNIIDGNDNRIMLIIGPCSADNEESVIDYISRLRPVQDKVQDKILIIPRIYTNKPRTTGKGYKGILHQPDPNKNPDLFKGIIATRELHMRAVKELGFACADEMLYPENHRYLDDLLAYVAVGARSVENQQHRLTASGIGIPVGMKNPTSGDFSVMMNAIIAAKSSHTFIYRNWEVRSDGNPYAHVILRGYSNRHGNSLPNYHYEDLLKVVDFYNELELDKPAVIIDTNHANSGKKPLEQPRIIREVLNSTKINNDIKKIVKGFMVESYIEDGNQPVDGGVYGKSITDACIGWEKTEKMIYDTADML